MSEPKRQMHLGVFVLGSGNHSAGWRMEGAYTSSCSLPVMKSIASIAERGKFDLFFISDGLAMDPGDHPSFVNRFEPLTLLAALSATTTHIGLGATVSTSFGEPYHVAPDVATPVDDTGAGDVFATTLLIEYHRSGDPWEAAAAAAVAGAAVVEGKGASGLLDRAALTTRLAEYRRRRGG